MSVGSKNRKRIIVGTVATCGTVLGAGATIVITSSPAHSIPSSARSCIVNIQTNTAANGWRAVNSVVKINNGRSARNVVVNFNADAGIDTGAEIRIGYQVDGGGIQTPGAQNFANHTEFWQTRHSMVVLRVPAGVHSIRPWWRISGAIGRNGVINGRCLTAEAYTS